MTEAEAESMCGVENEGMQIVKADVLAAPHENTANTGSPCFLVASLTHSIILESSQDYFSWARGVFEWGASPDGICRLSIVSVKPLRSVQNVPGPA